MRNDDCDQQYDNISEQTRMLTVRWMDPIHTNTTFIDDTSLWGWLQDKEHARLDNVVTITGPISQLLIHIGTKEHAWNVVVESTVCVVSV